jgi:hypothetical protein
MQDKYQKYTPPPTVYKSILEGLPPSPIITWDITSQIRRVVACPNVVTNMTRQFIKEADPKTAEHMYEDFRSTEWWERADGSIPEIMQKKSQFMSHQHLHR